MNVLIAHGQPLIQIGLEGALRACADLRVHSLPDTDLTLFDVAVTDSDIGMQLVTGAKTKVRHVIIVTSDASEIGIRRAIEAGVSGYLPMSATVESVAQAVRRVARGGTAIDPGALTKMIESLKHSKLTDREIEVLRLIALGRSNKAIANELGITVGTAKHHVKQLMAKLDARSRTEAASIAHGRGLVPRMPDRRSPTPFPALRHRSRHERLVSRQAPPPVDP